MLLGGLKVLKAIAVVRGNIIVMKWMLYWFSSIKMMANDIP
jgi:hypothetical protein